MERRLIVEQFDPESPRPGGIDTCIRGLVRYCPPHIDLRIAGVDAIGNKQLGEWRECEIGGRTVQFMPLARVDPANLRRRFPHSLQVAFGLRKYHPAPDADIVQTHRLNMGATALRLYRRAGHVQFIHWDGEDGVVSGSESYFRRAVFAYRHLENSVVPRSVETVVFNRAGADRLRLISPHVRFSPTWYDPVEFFPAKSEPAIKTRILWACRIDQGKNPSLAIDVLTALPPRYSLTVAGSGTLESAMRARAQASPAADRISFLGAVPKAQIGAVMRGQDLMLMTSRSEGFSRSIVEGLASGLPVVTAAAAEPNGLVQTGINGARVEGHATQKFVPAMEIASAISAKAARDSVSDLSALRVVPDVLSLGGVE